MIRQLIKFERNLLMSKLAKMQGVSAHLVTLKSDGKRRHPAHCVFSKGIGAQRTCGCEKCPKYCLRCTSATRCDYYKE